MSQLSSTAVSQEPTSRTSYTPVVSSSGMSYRPFLELGEGGMAKIYLARATGPGGFNKLVVLKVMRQGDQDGDTIRQMFVDEARLSARFNHPNLVQVQEVNLASEPPYLVMEYLDGKPLSALRRNERISLGMRLRIISEVLTGLHHAHELCNFDGSPLGIVHRDISPHNVFITYDGAVKVLDFGIAKMASNSSRTEAGEVKGKLAYMAPEQMLGTGIDRRADIFSVGSMLWESAVGRRMWEGMADATIMHRLAMGDIPRPSAHAAVDGELEEIIVKATANDPADRFSSALELQAELDRYITRAGEQSSLRQVGAELAEAFQTERRRNAELINAALRQSLPPPPAAIEDEPAAQQSEPASRTPLLVAIGLVVLAATAFIVHRWGGAQQAPAAEPTPVSSASAQAGVPMSTPSARPQAASAPASAAPAPSASVEQEPASGAAPRGRERLPRAGVAPPPAAARPTLPAESAAAPAASPATEEDRCKPPYYFVGGIKTYKPECL